ncbi:hypothetical protein FB45DRAFT_911679 [Roridomyces roridus]|uniref:Uncharacterized protein n=1 Tax=Roridomyces roridus TaxID=1738132 RepID=A0AAD7FLY3_9AGAR|nr:hypothetical protein FB45DRAFT_911679 [Roridomyces roridus]
MDLVDQMENLQVDDQIGKLKANMETAKAIESEYVEEQWGKLFPSSSSSSGVPHDTDDDDDDGDMLCIKSFTYDENGNVKAEKIPLHVNTEYTEQYPAHPPYRFVTPGLRSAWVRRINMTQAPFLPFPNDPAFPRDEYLRSFEQYQWETDKLDPDEELIQYEVVRRLHCDHDLTAAEIEEVRHELELLPLRDTNSNGLLWAASQRDAPMVIWGDGQSSAEKPPLPKYFAQETTEATDIFAQVNTGREQFCFNLNCIQDYCNIHVAPEWFRYKTPQFLSRSDEARLTSAAMSDQRRPACGEDCFRLIQLDDIEPESSAADSALVWSMLKFESDILPCDLAVLCKLPCRQAFFIRRQLISDTEVETRNKKVRRSGEKQDKPTFGNCFPLLLFTPAPHPSQEKHWNCNDIN